MVSEREQTAEKLSVEEQKIKEISKQYEKLKTLLDQKTQSRTRRLNTSTNLDTINNPNSGVRYRRRGETKNVLEFIHGGENGALLGAWDFVSAEAPKAMMENLIGNYRRGKYVDSKEKSERLYTI